MQKNILHVVRDFIVKRYKFAFPVVVVVAVAATVVIALNAGRKLPEELTETTESTETTEPAFESVNTEVPLVENEDGEIYTLLATYYNAVALGDTDTLLQLTDVLTDVDLARYQASAQYIEMYPSLEIFTKAGPEPGSTIAYVYYHVMFQNQDAEFPGYQALYLCTDENGKLYIKRGEISLEVNDYIKTVTAQADVVEFNNRITNEYNELMLERPELLEYLSEYNEQVEKDVGEILAKNSVETTQPSEEGQPDAQNPEGTEAGGQTETPADTQQPAENVKQYANATTTVNVRGSDSEQADKLGKVAGGTQLEVLENRVNGWSKVIFEGKEGYIKSEYLQMLEAGQSAEGVETVGTVTASTNINIRSSASETADKLGVMAGGETAELVANEGEWCKIKYNGQIGYVKAEYIQ